MRVATDSIEHYLQETLGLTARLTAWKSSGRLPFYLRDGFRFYQTDLLGMTCLLMVDQAKEPNSPAAVRKQMDQVRSKWNGELIYVRQQVASHHRKRLIEQRVPFLVPGNQMYLPMLGIDLREHFRKQRETPLTFKPATQALVLQLLLHRDDKLQTPVDFAQRLGYTKMTMSRAFDELEAEQLCDLMREGRERQLRLTESRKRLWENSLPLMRSPVQQRHYIRRLPDQEVGTTAGLTALAKYSMLATPKTPTVAVSRKYWKKIQDTLDRRKVIPDDPDSMEVEVWHYDPELFAEQAVVDRFSLFLSLRKDKDERVEAALDEMMEGIQWLKE